MSSTHNITFSVRRSGLLYFTLNLALILISVSLLGGTGNCFARQAVAPPTPPTLSSLRNQDDATPLSENSAPTQSQGQRIFNVLFQELDSMIPGEFEPESETKKAIEEAITAFQAKNIKRLEDIFKEQAAKNKSFPPSDLLLATLSYAIQDTDTGLLLLERAAINAPGYPGLYSSLGRLAVNQGRFTDALALLEKCERTIAAGDFDETAKTYFLTECYDGMIDVAMQQKRYDDARKYLGLQRANMPSNPKVLLVSAELEFINEDTEKSLEYLTQLNTGFPNTRPAELILASWYQRAGKDQETKKWIRDAAQNHPENVSVQLEFANWAITHEEFPLASSAIVKAEKIGSETLVTRNFKAKIAFCKQSYGIAELHYSEIAKQQPQNSDAVNMLALSLAESGDPEKLKKAHQIATQNFRSLPDNIVAQAALGYIEFKSGNLDQAQGLLATVAKNEAAGKVPELDYFIASLLHATGKNENAKKFLKRALNHDGIFLYRNPAKQLLESLGSEDLPTPEK